MLITIIPLLIMLAGILVYVLSSNAKLVEIGRIMFFVGLFFVAWATAGKVVRLI